MSVASACEPTPPPEDGLRTALRNVPLLPAPANVDDLLARLDAEEVPFSSGPLAELVADARYVEPEPWPANEDDRFFAPVTWAANTNERPPLASRLWGGLFKAGLAAGALLICWNALMTPDPAPPRPGAPSTEASAPSGEEGSAVTHAAALPDLVREPAPEARARDVVLLEPPELPAELIVPHQAFAPDEPTALSEPTLEPVPMVPEPMLDLKVAQADGLPPAAEPSALSEPAPAASAAVLEAEPANSPEAIRPVRAAEPPEPVTPEPTQEAEVQSNESFASLAAAEPPPATPVRDAEATPAAAAPESAPPIESSSPAADSPEPILVAEAEPVAIAVLPPPRDLLELRGNTASASAPAPDRAKSERLTPPEPRGVRTAALAAPPPLRSKARERLPFAGTWAASPEACDPAMQKGEEGHLLARIGPRGGRAGDTSCAFRTIRRQGSTWHIGAACWDGETSWKSDVRLSLSRGRLTWASQKGSTTYGRCPRA